MTCLMITARACMLDSICKSLHDLRMNRCELRAENARCAVVSVPLRVTHSCAARPGSALRTSQLLRTEYKAQYSPGANKLGVRALGCKRTCAPRLLQVSAFSLTQRS
jgi:hypothetical protein